MFHCLHGLRCLDCLYWTLKLNIRLTITTWFLKYTIIAANATTFLHSSELLCMMVFWQNISNKRMGSNINSVESQLKHKTMFPRVLMNIVHDLTSSVWPHVAVFGPKLCQVESFVWTTHDPNRSNMQSHCLPPKSQSIKPERLLCWSS